MRGKYIILGEGNVLYSFYSAKKVKFSKEKMRVDFEQNKIILLIKESKSFFSSYVYNNKYAFVHDDNQDKIHDKT